MVILLRTLIGVLCLHVWQGTAAAATSYTKDVAPLLVRHCAACHQPGGASRTSLLTFADARARAKQIVEATAARRMPPWLPDGEIPVFADDRRLSDQEIDTFRRWLDEGAPEGDATVPPLSLAIGHRAKLGTPDLVLTTPQITIEPGASHRSLNIVLPVPLEGVRYVRAWEIVATNPALVRHATLTVDARNAPSVFEIDHSLADAGSLFPSPGLDALPFDWTPGDPPGVAAAGSSWPIGPSVPPVLHADLVTVAKPETLSSFSIALYFGESESLRVPALVRLTRQSLEIPAGSTTLTATDTSLVPVDVDIQTVQVHAKELARQVRVAAVTPDQREVILLSVDEWDARAQHSFTFMSPLRLPAGSRITMSIRYDNSRSNAQNPNSPPIAVRLGRRVVDERAEVWLRVLPVRPEDRPALIEAVRRHVIPEELQGRSRLAREDPRSAGARDMLAAGTRGRRRPGRRRARVPRCADASPRGGGGSLQRRHGDTRTRPSGRSRAVVRVRSQRRFQACPEPPATRAAESGTRGIDDRGGALGPGRCSPTTRSGSAARGRCRGCACRKRRGGDRAHATRLGRAA